MKKTYFLGLLLSASLILSLAATTTPVQAQLPLPSGVPRGDVLVVENHWGTYIDPKDFNFKPPGKPATGGNGFQQLCGAYLWYINTTTGLPIDWLAAGPPEYSADFKTVKFFIRKGVHWNDGVPFTADDVVFTIDTALATAGWGTHAFATVWIESATALDDYTVEIKLKNPYPRFHYQFTVIIYGSGWWIVPKHVWEKEDPVSFKNYPPVSIGPYNLESVDPAGNWFLWVREEHWWATELWGLKPCPKYVLYIHQGPDEKKALAMIRDELDCLRTLLPEALEMVIAGNPYAIGWRRSAPFAWPYDACVKGIGFNVARYPYNITEVRRALTFAINYTTIYEAFRGIDGSVPSTTPLPLVPYPFAWKEYFDPIKDDLVELGLDPETWWWKYDPAYAETLLKSVGFTRGGDGKWLLPNGQPWKLTITGPSGFEMESARIAFLTAEEWKRFGVDVTVELVEAGVFSARDAKGEEEVGTRWPGCTLLLDLTPHLQWLNSKYYDPLAPGHSWNIFDFPKREELDSLHNQMETTSTEDTATLIELSRKIVLIWAEQMPNICYFPTPFWTMQDSYAWDGWPTYPDNYYMDPVSWWAQHMFVILKVYPTGRAPIKEALLKPGGEMPKPPVTTVTVTVTETAAATTVTQTETQTTTETETVTAMDVTSVAGAGVVALIVGVVVGWLVASRKKT